MAEIEAIERMCRFAEYLEQPVLVFHVSTAEGADVVRAAQARGAPVWAETCPHYLMMTQNVLGLPLAIDQGWCKIYQICPGARVGLVDEAKGMNKWAAIKPVQLYIRVTQVDDCYAHELAKELDNLSELFANDTLGIRAFAFNDPDGYQIETQSATRAST